MPARLAALVAILLPAAAAAQIDAAQIDAQESVPQESARQESAAPPRTAPAAPVDPSEVAPHKPCPTPWTACAVDPGDPCLESAAFLDPLPAEFDRQAGRQKRQGDPCVQRLSEIRVCLAELVTLCGAGTEILPSDTGRTFVLRGTRWVGEDSEKASLDLLFDEGGVVDYITDTGHWRTGRYLRHGADLVISMNDGYSVYLGRVGVSELRGAGWNVRDRRWLWEALREGEPRAPKAPEEETPPADPAADAAPKE